MTKDLEELTDEIRKLRKELRELRESGGTHIHHHYAPLPVYVPQYPQPSYLPWWQTVTVGGINVGGGTTTTYGTILNNTDTALPASSQVSLT